MNIYALVAQHCQTADTAQIQRLVGTLRSAGFDDEIQDRELPIVKETLADISQQRMLRNRPTHTARAALVDQGRMTSKQMDQMKSVDGMDRFIEIEAYIEKGQCPRCHTAMVKVKLGSHVPGDKGYMQANYCKACRTTLWTK